METLRLNSTGPNVELLQNTLNRIGFNAGPIDGEFGNRTLQAVLRFQRAVGLVADGIVGPNTWAALMPYINGYAEHTIQSGNTLYFLASAYNTTVEAIIVANPGIDINNLQVGQRIIIPFTDSVVPTNISYSYEIMQLNLQALKARYPFIQTGLIGESVLGRVIPFIKIGTGTKEVSYNASHHANEWITTPLLMRFTEQLCRAAAFGFRIAGIDAATLLSEVTFYIVPMVNPDGVDLVVGALGENTADYRQALAMNTPPLPFPSGWKANIRGTDLNLNYPAGWENAREIKYAQGFTRPGPRDFVGEFPLSEPETVAMADFTAQHNFLLILAYHTQGEIIYWRYLNYNPPRSLEIAQAFAEVSGYEVAETPYESGFAGYKDWFIQEYNRPGYTIEAGRGINPLPISQFPEIYRDNLGILVLGGALI